MFIKVNKTVFRKLLLRVLKVAFTLDITRILHRVVFDRDNYYRVAKKVSHYQMIKNRIKTYLSLSVRIDLLVKLKYESSTLILFVGTRYSMRNLFSDLSE